MNNKVKAFAIIAFIEGISYVVLLGLAMPLKYFFDLPLAVTIIGWAHGVLFMLYLVLLLVCWIEYKWSLTRIIKYGIASLLPVLPFFVERKLRQEYNLLPSK